MSYDLTGQDAFDKLLDAALAANFDAKNAIQRAQTAEADKREMAKDLSRIQAEFKALAVENAKAKPILEALWKAADCVARSTESPTMGALREAIIAADPYCGDQIPF